VHGRDDRRVDFDRLLFPVTGCVTDRRSAAGFPTTRAATRSSGQARSGPPERARGHLKTINETNPPAPPAAEPRPQKRKTANATASASAPPPSTSSDAAPKQ